LAVLLNVLKPRLVGGVIHFTLLPFNGLAVHIQMIAKIPQEVHPQQSVKTHGRAIGGHDGHLGVVLHFRPDGQGIDARPEGLNHPAIGNLRKALLVFHSPRDTTVSIDNAAQIFMAAKHPKSFVSLDDADHLLTRREDAAYVAAVLSAWASRYLGEPAAPARPIAANEPGIVTVAETREGKFAQEVRVGRHQLRADEPVDAGGTDTGPSPYDFVLAGLGACTSMTIRMYADLKKLPLDKVTVRLRHDKVHAADCADCETREGRIDRIEREVELAGNLDESQRAKLLEIANKCPVHRTLHSEIWIPTRLKT